MEKAYELVERFRELEEEKKSIESRLEKVILTIIDEEAKNNPIKPVWESGTARMFIVKRTNLVTWGINGCVWTESAEVLKEVVKRSGPVKVVERFKNILSKAKNGICTIEFKGGNQSKWWTQYHYTKTIDERYLRNVIEKLEYPSKK